MKATARPSAEFLRECLEYREGILYWRVRPVWHFSRPADCIAFNTKTAGKQAGKKDPQGYVHLGLRIGGKAISMAAHRVVWALHHGRWPDLHIDHINRVRDDNRIENLREATPAENSKNCARQRVHPYVYEGKWNGFHAQTNIGGQKIVHLGTFDTEAEAIAHRDLVNAALEGLARNLAKKAKTGRKPKQHQTFAPPDADGSSLDAIPQEPK